MTAAIARHRGLVDTVAEIFDAIDVAPIERVVVEHQQRARAIDRLFDVLAEPEAADALELASIGNKWARCSLSDFGAKVRANAHRALDTQSWQAALDATDVLDAMPAERRSAWLDAIGRREVPAFSAENVRETIREHLANRAKYFAERVDGVFQALSRGHKTNRAEGFGARLILNGVIADRWCCNEHKVAVLADLRYIVARFVGRECPKEAHDLRNITSHTLRYAQAQSPGEWFDVDGGAMSWRVYLNGNVHVRLHTELVWRLNGVLASVRPGSIPEAACTRPSRSAKTPRGTPLLFDRPLPFPVVAVLRALAQTLDRGSLVGYYHGWRSLDKHVRAAAVEVVRSLGGDVDDGRVVFDYPAADALSLVVATGMVPDDKAHQFYPTPASVVAVVRELADVAPHERVLEPSAGLGALVEGLNPGLVTCCEVAPLRVAVLEAKGYRVVCGSFLDRSHTPELLAAGAPAVVLMNPPFAQGQWMEHVHRAALLLRDNRRDLQRQRIVAVLPVSASSLRWDLPGFAMTWSAPIAGAFAGTSTTVVVLLAELLGHG